MSDKTELLPCPFCGGRAKVSSFPGAHNVWCENQPVKCGNRAMFTVDEWNTRAAPAEDVREVADEPVLFRVETPRVIQGGEVKEWWPGFCWLRPDEVEALVGPYRIIETMYRHPQREVVMPERMYSLLPGADYWNACLDEFKRLNR